MKILTCISPGFFEYGIAEMPNSTLANAIIKVKNIGICGTDLHAFEGSQPYFTYPRILGHELSGELVETGGAPGFEQGEAVTFLPYFNCGKCIACRLGLTNCCAHLKVFGVHINGGMMEYISVPADKLMHGEELSFDMLALVEPLAIGAHAIGKAAVKKDEFVIVVGAGPIGLAVMEFANIAGGKIIAIDVNDKRLRFCKEKLKIEHIINTKTENAVEQVNAITNSEMASVVIDATGNLNAINNGINYLAHGGRYVLVGLQKHDFSFNHPEFHKRETMLMSSRNATRADFAKVITSIKSGLIEPQKFITHRVGFDEVKEHFNDWLDPANGVIKAVINM